MKQEMKGKNGRVLSEILGLLSDLLSIFGSIDELHDTRYINQISNDVLLISEFLIGVIGVFCVGKGLSLLYQTELVGLIPVFVGVLLSLFVHFTISRTI